MARNFQVARNYLDVTPSDTVNLSKGAADAFFVGGAGTIVIMGEDGDTASFAVADGDILPCGGGKVMATGTTATGIVALYV